MLRHVPALHLPAAALLFLAAAAPALSQEPDLRLLKDTAADQLVTLILPNAALPTPESWNLYRGALSDLPSYLQHGDPDGRCDVLGTDSAIILNGELTTPGSFYYLLSAYDPSLGETGLGTDSLGTLRPNTDPCPRAACGTEVIPTAAVRDTEGIAIAPDGTLYYSQRATQSVGRRLPGGAADNTWVALAGATTIWGLAYRADGMLFVGSPTAGGRIFQIDTTQPAPVATVLYAAAGGANGVIIGPDDAVYYSDFNAGRVYRVDGAGVRTEVTTSAIAQANGLFFDDDGTLLVLAYGAAQVWRLQLDASMVEVFRVLETTVAGARLDGIARDDTGRWYLGDNGGGRLLRYDRFFSVQEAPLLTGVGAATNIAFGKGALDCMDVYMASSGALARFDGDATGRP